MPIPNSFTIIITKYIKLHANFMLAYVTCQGAAKKGAEQEPIGTEPFVVVYPASEKNVPING
jgi:hypothetical protein